MEENNGKILLNDEALGEVSGGKSREDLYITCPLCQKPSGYFTFSVSEGDIVVCHACSKSFTVGIGPTDTDN